MNEILIHESADTRTMALYALSIDMIILSRRSIENGEESKADVGMTIGQFMELANTMQDRVNGVAAPESEKRRSMDYLHEDP